MPPCARRLTPWPCSPSSLSARLASSGSTSSTTTFLHPEPGTSALDHLAGGLIPLGALGARSLWPTTAGGQGSAAAIALVAGLFALVIGAASAGYQTITVGPSGDDFTGLLVLPAGLALIGVGVVTLWRSRKLSDSRFVRRCPQGVDHRCYSRSWRTRRSRHSHSAMSSRTSIPETVPAATLRRRARERLRQDERRPRAPGLVRAVEERRRGDRLPGPQRLSGAHPDARAPRLRRPALRPPRRRQERGRQQPAGLGRRQGHPRRDRVP